jgi:hypothetical protein
MVLEPGQNLVVLDVNGQERLRLTATGNIRIRGEDRNNVVRVDAESASLFVGGLPADGDLLLFPRGVQPQDADTSTVHLSGGESRIRAGTDARPGVVRVHGAGQRIELLGENGTILTSGNIEVRSPDGEVRARLTSGGGVVAGGGGEAGVIRVRSGRGDTRILLNGTAAHATFGGDGANGQVIIKDENGTTTIVLNGATANVGLGVEGNAGALFVKDDSGKDSIVLNGATANVGVGAEGNAGAIFVKDNSGEDSIVLNGETGNMALGRSGNGGDLFLKDDSGQDAIVMRGTTGNLGIGRFGRDGNIFVKNDKGEDTIHLSGNTGDILLRNADCAEDFDVEDECVEPGDVMVIGEGDALRRCQAAYDRRVAGVISGAGTYSAGMVLDRRPSDRARMPLALVGKIFCKADANHGAIRVGDLLTTSPTPGCAMRAADPVRAFGAVIGKALGSLDSGQGMVAVLVGLQ